MRSATNSGVCPWGPETEWWEALFTGRNAVSTGRLGRMELDEFIKGSAVSPSCHLSPCSQTPINGRNTSKTTFSTRPSEAEVHLRLLCVHTSPLDVSTVSECAIEVERGRYWGNVFVSLQKRLFNTEASNKTLCCLLLWREPQLCLLLFLKNIFYGSLKVSCKLKCDYLKFINFTWNIKNRHTGIVLGVIVKYTYLFQCSVCMFLGVFFAHKVT